jgi:hypothetical protein
MMTEEEEQRALLAEMADACFESSHLPEDSGRHCAGCGCAFDGCVESDGPVLREELCPSCWQEAAERTQAARKHSYPIVRVVRLGFDQDASFVVESDSERTIWVRKDQSAFEIPYFEFMGKTDAELAKKIKGYLPFA